MFGELEAHCPGVVIKAAVLHDEEQRLLVAAIVMGMNCDWRRDRGRPRSPVLALAFNDGEAALALDRTQGNACSDVSSGMNAACTAGMACCAIVSGVQPSARCTIRIGRGELNR